MFYVCINVCINTLLYQQFLSVSNKAQFNKQKAQDFLWEKRNNKKQPHDLQKAKYGTF